MVVREVRAAMVVVLRREGSSIWGFDIVQFKGE